MSKVKNKILKIVQVWKVLPKKMLLQMLWWIFLLILIFAIPNFGVLVAIIYFPYLLLRKIIRYADKKW